MAKIRERRPAARPGTAAIIKSMLLRSGIMRPMDTNPSSVAPMIVGIGGTSRPNSTSERAVTVALRAAEQLGAKTRLFNGEFVSRLPLYVPERSTRNADEMEFI